MPCGARVLGMWVGEPPTVSSNTAALGHLVSLLLARTDGKAAESAEQREQQAHGRCPWLVLTCLYETYMLFVMIVFFGFEILYDSLLCISLRFFECGIS